VTETVPDPEFLRTSQFIDSIKPELVVPLVVFLASKACGLTHHNYSACAGRFARAFVGLGEGWVAERGTVPSAEDIAAHIEQISATTSFTVPASIFDEVFGVCERLSITP
jgi:hypothetical protein